MSTSLRGIDVSHFQGSVHWPSVADSNVVFCFVKATEGIGYVDPCFQANWAGSAAAGLLRGAYHFGHASTDPVAQARHFFATVGALGPKDLPPVLDLETLDGQSPADTLQWALDFLAEADTLFGRNTIVYTDTGFWQSVGSLPGCQVLAQRPLWLAAHNAQPQVPAPWRTWTFWQYSNGTRYGGTLVPGVCGDVDQNWFAGTLSDLATLSQPL